MNQERKKQAYIPCNICGNPELVNIECNGTTEELETFTAQVRRNYECARCLGNMEDLNKVKTYRSG